MILIKAINTAIDMNEDILGNNCFSLNLKSFIFIKLHRKSGGDYDNKKFRD